MRKARPIGLGIKMQSPFVKRKARRVGQDEEGDASHQGLAGGHDEETPGMVSNILVACKVNILISVD